MNTFLFTLTTVSPHGWSLYVPGSDRACSSNRVRVRIALARFAGISGPHRYCRHLLDMMARRTRHDMTVSKDRPDMIDPTLKMEPIDSTEPNEPMDPMDNADPLDPIESTEPLDAM